MSSWLNISFLNLRKHIALYDMGGASSHQLKDLTKTDILSRRALEMALESLNCNTDSSLGL